MNNKIESEDVSTGRFKNGTLGIVEAATAVYPLNLEETISVFGETDTIKLAKTASLAERWNVQYMTEESVNDIV